VRELLSGPADVVRDDDVDIIDNGRVAKLHVSGLAG